MKNTVILFGSIVYFNEPVKRNTLKHDAMTWEVATVRFKIAVLRQKPANTWKYELLFERSSVCNSIWYYSNNITVLLAHLSRRLTRWAYSIPMVHRPSVIVRRPHFQTWISLKPVGQSWSNFMCSITGVGERLHKVLGKIGSKLWFPWQQKAPVDL